MPKNYLKAPKNPKISVDDPVFCKAFDELILKEGGYVNNKYDTGGETKYGISKKSYPDKNIKSLTKDDAKLIYYFDYWLPNKCHLLPPLVGSKYFDMCVNMGKKQATILLQRAIMAVGNQIDVDGRLGPQTLGFLENSKGIGEIPTLAALRSEMAGFYRLLACRDPKKGIFLNGWLTRAYA
ncbi:MAG: hypothetical protein EOM67_01610 [Spirochaetia bacterium]|nr:hypothetical protein [Spirochaetia bacterium]